MLTFCAACCRSPLATFLQEPELTASSLKGASLRVRLDTICEAVNRDREGFGGCNEATDGRTPLGIMLECWNGNRKRFALEVLQKVQLQTILQHVAIACRENELKSCRFVPAYCIN